MKLQSENTPEVEAHESGSDLKVEAKLPKLHITKFNGTYGDWPRFWNLFSETIDKSSISPVNKFAYLQELLCEKAERSIEALPHTSEGYNRAISILTDRFGKESEVVKTFVKEVLELQHIATANTKKIHDFYEKLSCCVQSLEKLKQLDVINGTVSMVLDKLPTIRGDLVRNDFAWEKWNFVQFTEALQLWTRRNPLTEEAKSDDPSKKHSRVKLNSRARYVRASTMIAMTIDQQPVPRLHQPTNARQFWLRRKHRASTQRVRMSKYNKV